MTVPGGEPIESMGVSVISAARPKFETSAECVVGEDKSEVIALAKTTDESSPFDLGPCVSSIKTVQIPIELRRPNGTNYRFASGQQYSVLVTAVRKVGDEQKNAAKIYQTDPTVDTRSAVFKLSVAGTQFEPVRDITDEGTIVRLKLVDPRRGESDWYTLGQEFVDLPTNLLVDCSTNNQCRLSGDLGKVDQVAVEENQNGDPQWTEVRNVPDGSFLRLPLIKIPLPTDGSPYYFYIRTRGSSRSIKVRFLKNNTSIVYKPAVGEKVFMSPTD
jgi:hypothetical protein